MASTPAHAMPRATSPAKNATPRSTGIRRRKLAPEPIAVDDDARGTQHLESLLGYNAHRAALVLVGGFMRSMAPFDLRTVDFSVLSVLRHQPGLTSRQLCHQLAVLPPNMVTLLRQLEERGLIARHPHPTDGRAMGLSLSAQGLKLIQAAEKASQLGDQTVSARLTATERKTLARLLQKIYLGAD